MKFSELLEHCKECVKTFNPVISTIDSHADNYLSNIKDPYEKVFVKQVFYGCIRYQDFLKVFIKKFYELNPIGTNRNDQVLYTVFAYMSFFRLEELAIEDFRKLVLSQDPGKMHTFLQFVFDCEAHKTNGLRDAWMLLYDYQYIDEKIIGGIEKNVPNVANILSIIEKKATGRITSTLSQSAASQSQFSETVSQGTGGQRSMGGQTPALEGEIGSKQLTVQQPFNLTKPKPKKIPEPEAIAQQIQPIPFPNHIFKKTVTDIEKEKEERRKIKTDAIRREYEENPRKRFELASEARPGVNKFDKAKEVLEEGFQEKLKFSGTKPRKMPDFDSKQYPEVKLTAAAVKREALAIKKAEETEAKRLKDLEWNQRDETEFVTWKKEMDEREEILRLDYIQRKKIEMELSREEAILAQQKQAHTNKINAKKMKVESNVRLDQREKNLKEEFGRRVEIVDKVHEQKFKTSEAVQTMKDENRELRNMINKEISEALKRKKDEEQAEHRRKQELIRQIRELEKIPIVRTKGFDPTEAGGHGLLEEMSVAELRERIEYNRRKIEQDTEKKRQDNLTRKDKEADDLEETKAKIEDARNKRRQDNDAKRKAKNDAANALEEKRRQMREQGLIEAYDKIKKKKQDKQEADERLAKELKEIRLQRQYMNANAAMVEEKAWKELEAGAERQIRNKQNEKLIDQCKTNGITVKDQSVRAFNKRTEVVDKLEYDKSYQERLTVRKKENEMLHKNTLKSH